MNENTFEISGQATFARTLVFQPTTRLRFVDRVIPIDEHTATKVRVLQQLWAAMYTTETEWRDVPLEDPDV